MYIHTCKNILVELKKNNTLSVIVIQLVKSSCAYIHLVQRCTQSNITQMNEISINAHNIDNDVTAQG